MELRRTSVALRTSPTITARGGTGESRRVRMRICRRRRLRRRRCTRPVSSLVAHLELLMTDPLFLQSRPRLAPLPLRPLTLTSLRVRLPPLLASTRSQPPTTTGKIWRSLTRRRRRRRPPPPHPPQARLAFTTITRRPLPPPLPRSSSLTASLSCSALPPLPLFLPCRPPPPAAATALPPCHPPRPRAATALQPLIVVLALPLPLPPTPSLAWLSYR